MRKTRCGFVELRTALAIVVLLATASSAVAAQSPASVKSADQYIANGNLKAAEIELRNAVRDAPQDPQLRIRLARVYLQLGDPISAEREARAARERNGAEADYLPVLDQALLRQGKFQELSDLVRPGNRPPLSKAKCAGHSVWRRPVSMTRSERNPYCRTLSASIRRQLRQRSAWPA
jgi:Tetratricopeptide repeat